MEVIAWLGVSQALFSGLLTLTKGQKSISDRLLSAWLFLLAIEFLSFGLESKIFPDFVLLSNSFLLFNPALYLYTCSLANPAFKLNWKQLLHLLPYLFFKVSVWIIREPQSFEHYLEPNKTLWFRILFAVFGIVSWGVYLWLTGAVLTRHRKQIRNEFSTIDMFKKIGWIFFIVVFYIVYCFSVFLWGLFNVIVYDTRSITMFIYAVHLFFIYIFGFYGLKQRDIFSHKETLKKTETSKTNLLILNHDVVESIQKKLYTYFEKDKPYLNPDLNMTLLSEKLKIPKHHLTEVLNANIGKNFFQFVNEYRIEAVKGKLSNPKNPYSIEAIGFECGFNSKSTFFSVFKTMTGLTPLEYKKKIAGGDAILNRI